MNWAAQNLSNKITVEDLLMANVIFQKFFSFKIVRNSFSHPECCILVFQELKNQEGEAC